MAFSITKQLLEDQISEIDYHRDEKSTLTFCIIRLKNGWVQDGSSACIDPDMFDEQIGRDVAYQDAFNKLWRLKGYVATNVGFDKYREMRGI